MLTIIGCGNLNRRDDGAGVVVAQRLRRRLTKHPVPAVQALDCGTGGIDVMFQARGSDALLILDASKSGAEPGAVHEVPGSELAQDWVPSLSLHDFRWQHALAAGKRIFRDAFPQQVQVWLVEAERLDLGLELSPAVVRACDTLYERALSFIAKYSAGRHGPRAGGVAQDDEGTRQGAGRPGSRARAEEQGGGRPPQPTSICLHQGSLRISREVYARYFDGCEGALLIERDEGLCVVPVEPTSGGLLVKQRTRRGDRVIHAQEFFAQRGVDPLLEAELPIEWNPKLGCLTLPMPGSLCPEDEAPRLSS